MPHLGFDVRDYYTDRVIDAPLWRDLLVVVPRRPTLAPPLVERTFSSLRLAARSFYFDVTKNGTGDYVVPDVPPGNYDVLVAARGYVTERFNATSPMTEPMSVPLRRAVTFPFATEDTIIRGNVVSAAGGPYTGFDVTLNDAPELITRTVPLDEEGRYVFFLPEKRTIGAVQIDVARAGGLPPITINVASVQLHRRNIAPLITVP